jgi:hypothetical protein
VARGIAGQLAGKIVVDCNNTLTWKDGPVWNPPPEGSLTQALAKAAPGARMVKGWNTFGAEFHKDPTLAGAAARISGRARAAIFLYRLSRSILAQWARDKCPQQAAALAFQTALSLVPVTAIAFSLLRAFGSLDAESRLSQFVSERIFPQMSDVTDRIREFSGKVSIGALGGGGLLFTLITCYSLYSYVEKIFNDIWRVGERRTLIGKFLTFYAMVTLLPSAAAFSLYWSGRLVESGSVSRFIMSGLIQLLALTFMTRDSAKTVTAGVASLSGTSIYELPWGPISAAVVVSTLPLIVMVVLFQRRIIQGLTAGATKG